MLFCHNVLLSSFSCYLLTTKLRLYFESCKKKRRNHIIVNAIFDIRNFSSDFQSAKLNNYFYFSKQWGEKVEKRKNFSF